MLANESGLWVLFLAIGVYSVVSITIGLRMTFKTDLDKAEEEAVDNVHKIQDENFERWADERLERRKKAIGGGE